MTNLSLLTINTWKNDGPYRQRLACLTRELLRLQPDVICCQEVFRTVDDAVNQTDTGRNLADALGMQYTCAPARRKLRLFDGQLVDCESGLAVLSRYPIRHCEISTLPTDERDGDRLAQFVQLDINDSSVLIVNTHLTHLRHCSDLRQRQLDAILTHSLLANAYDAIFLAGDFNAESPSSEIQFLLTHPAPSVRNTYTAGGGLPPGYTMPGSQTAAITQPARGRCIDFIFSIAHPPAHHPVVTAARVVLDTPDAEGIYPSDHYGILIQTQLPPP